MLTRNCNEPELSTPIVRSLRFTIRDLGPVLGPTSPIAFYARTVWAACP